MCSIFSEIVTSALMESRDRSKGDVNLWVKILASVAAATAFVALTIVGGRVAVKKWKVHRNNRVQSLSLEHIIYDVSNPSTTTL